MLRRLVISTRLLDHEDEKTIIFRNVVIYQLTRSNNPEDSNLEQNGCENLKSRISENYFT